MRCPRPRLSVTLPILLALAGCSDTTGPDPSEPTSPGVEPRVSTTEVQKLTASDGATGEYFGNAIAIDGDVTVVTAQLDDDNGPQSGSAYVFERVAGTWSEVAKLTASDGAESQHFGSAVDIDGDRILVGASGDQGPGSAYVFERFDGQWTEVAKLTAVEGTVDDLGFLGGSVSLSGDVAVIGAWGDDELGPFSGSAVVFERGSDGTWSQREKLTASDGAVNDVLAQTVVLDGNLVVVGASQDDDLGENSGSAYVFERVAGTWSEVAKLTASDAGAGDNFGFALAAVGEMVVVGAHFDRDKGFQTGSAYVFEGSGGLWSEAGKLIPSDARAGDRIGEAVAVDGSVAVIGARQTGRRPNGPGAAFVFERSDEQWTEMAKLTASDGVEGDKFGSAVAVEGDVALVSAVQGLEATKPGAVYVFDLSSP